MVAWFDCGHAGDLLDYDLMMKLWSDDEYTKYILDYRCNFDDDVLRTKEYVQEECKSLVDQIIELTEIINKEKG